MNTERVHAEWVTTTEDRKMQYKIESDEDGRAVIILHRSDRFLVLVRAPKNAAVGESWTGEIDWDHGEGPYAMLDSPTTGHDQSLIENYLLHQPGETRDEAMDAVGLDDESLLPARY